MPTQEGKVIATGGWPSREKQGVCPDNPKAVTSVYRTFHFWESVDVKPSQTELGRKAGERLVTSRCKYCGALIVDCPTISV